jgi:hypothetical protein
MAAKVGEAKPFGFEGQGAKCHFQSARRNVSQTNSVTLTGNVGVAGCEKMGIRTISMTIAVAVDWLALLGGKQNYLDKNWHTVDNHSRASSCLP